MNELVELDRAKKRLTGAFKRADQLLDDDLQLQSDFAKYLTVITSGYLEVAVRHTLGHIVELNGGSSASRNHSLSHLGRRSPTTRNLNAKRLLDLVRRFDPSWAHDLDKYIEGERKDAIDSLVNTRNGIAHGDDTGITFVRVSAYRARILEVVDELQSIVGI